MGSELRDLLGKVMLSPIGQKAITTIHNPFGLGNVRSARKVAAPIVGMAVDAAKLPGDAYNKGMTRDEMERRSVDAAMTLPMASLPLSAVAGPTGASLGMFVGKMSRDNRLRVARKMPDGSIKAGPHGGTHSDLIDFARDNLDQAENAMGFITPDGRFLTRDQAAKRQLLNRPGGLHSRDIEMPTTALPPGHHYKQVGGEWHVIDDQGRSVTSSLSKEQAARDLWDIKR